MKRPAHLLPSDRRFCFHISHTYRKDSCHSCQSAPRQYRLGTSIWLRCRQWRWRLSVRRYREESGTKPVKYLCSALLCHSVGEKPAARTNDRVLLTRRCFLLCLLGSGKQIDRWRAPLRQLARTITELIESPFRKGQQTRFTCLPILRDFTSDRQSTLGDTNVLQLEILDLTAAASGSCRYRRALHPRLPILVLFGCFNDLLQLLIGGLLSRTRL